MEIQSLQFVVTDDDLNEWVTKLFGQSEHIRLLPLAFVPEGIRITGIYRTAVEVPFETLWGLSIHDGKIVAQLQKLKVGALSLGLAKGYVLKAIASRMRRVELRGDTLVCDVDLLLKEKGISLRTNLKSMRCDHGRLIVESGCGAGGS